ncbi:CPBP family intramembrane glutamic endopeptidase [Thomasclavelia ramosa]|jgi:membrane protease YdiL (CAAX protease family)|uniref:CPBP family intramembrane glutamic endopeptidase n=1 Tax=Thomasclavelia ramosa TaxID=1547 RepID=UPI0032C096C9
MISKKKANYMVTNYTMTKGFSILCKALIIYILFYFIIGAVLISVVPDDLSVYLRLTVTCITFIGMIFISKDYFKNKFVNDSMDVLDNSLKLAIISFALVMVNSFLTYINESMITASTYNNDLIKNIYTDSPVILGIISIALLPFIEEIFFKYVLFKNTDCLKKHWIIKTLIIGLLFAFVHCASEVIKLDITAFIYMLNYFIFYVATNIIYHKKENLMMVVIIHMLINICAVVLM